MSLPGELRNKIYSYVLESYKENELGMLPVLLCDTESPYSLHFRERGHSGWHKVNQLKYVCRQLYFETRFLGLKGHTHLYFPTIDGIHDYPGPAALQFLQTCAPAFCDSLQELSVDAQAMCRACNNQLSEDYLLKKELDSIKGSIANSHVQVRNAHHVCTW